MRLAISNIAWSKVDDELIYNFLLDHHIDALEIAPTRLFEAHPYDDLTKATKYAQSLKQNYNLSIVSLQSIWYGKDENIFRSKQERDVLLEYTYKVIDFAQAIQCQNIVFGNPKQRNGFKLDDESNIQDFFIKIANYAKDRNIVIALEPNPAIYGTNFLNTTRETIRFINEINHPNIKLNLDIGAMIENNESVDSITNNSNLINHIHVSEPYLKPIKKRKIHKELKKLDYNGVVSIEMNKVDSIDEIKTILDYMRGIINDK